MEKADEEWQIQLPSGGSILINTICKDCKVEVQEWMMDANLIVVNMHDFDVIFGMN